MCKCYWQMKSNLEGMKIRAETTVDDPGFIVPGVEDHAVFATVLQHAAIGATPDRVRRDEPAALDVAGCDQRPRFGEPVAHEIGLGGHPPSVELEDRLHVSITQVAAHQLTAQERWVADDRVRLRPRRLTSIRR